VGTGGNVLIAGFVIGGTTSKTVLIRAIGPSLAQFGVSGELSDPVLELHDETGSLIASNDNWKDTQEGEIEATGIPPTDAREPALIATLAPGNYTTIVRGANSATGIALVEVYKLSSTP